MAKSKTWGRRKEHSTPRRGGCPPLEEHILDRSLPVQKSALHSPCSTCPVQNLAPARAPHCKHGRAPLPGLPAGAMAADWPRSAVLNTTHVPSWALRPHSSHRPRDLRDWSNLAGWMGRLIGETHRCADGGCARVGRESRRMEGEEDCYFFMNLQCAKVSTWPTALICERAPPVPFGIPSRPKAPPRCVRPGQRQPAATTFTAPSDTPDSHQRIARTFRVFGSLTAGAKSQTVPLATPSQRPPPSLPPPPPLPLQAVKGALCRPALCR